MSDSIRVRLQFDKFSSPDLRNCLLSINTREIVDIKDLKQLIQKRHRLPQDILLLIDGFVLDDEDKIDGLVRDNETIGVEPKPVKIKTEQKTCVSEQNPKKSGSSGRSRSSSKRQSDSSKKRKLDLDDSDDSDKLDLKTNVKTEPTPNQIKHEEDIRPDIKSDPSAESEQSTTYSRNIPVRKAFQNANTSLKQKPQVITAQKPSTSNETPKPKKKKPPREATEPMDRFSPFIIIDRCLGPINHTELEPPINTTKKQSARKTFPSSSRRNNNNTNGDKSLNPKDLETLVEEIERESKNKVINDDKTSQKSIDFDNCEPLTSFPIVGDIIAFKMLTLSANGKGYESSDFKVATVLNIANNKMVDILLQDVVNKNNIKPLSKSDECVHSLKIDWSTILEPKLIRSASEESDPQTLRTIEAITID